MKKDELLILVNNDDQPIGSMEKMTVHKLGKLHRAFSIFIFNTKGELLLQQRATDKYHSAGLWSNTCCSHPKFGEEMNEALARRLQEEMGLQCELEFLFKFIYRADFPDGITEHEMDYVFIGFSDDLPEINPEEVNSWRYQNIYSILQNMNQHPEDFTVWFKICFDKFIDHFLTIAELQKLSTKRVEVSPQIINESKFFVQNLS